MQGHLGKVSDGAFSELITTTLYFDNMKALWDLQTSVMAYAAANDQLTGSNFPPADPRRLRRERRTG